jgi:zinc/manganese transport system substrate-binding protein
MRKRVTTRSLRSWLFGACFVLCIAGANVLAASPLAVASLSTVLTDLARNVGGDKVRVLEIVRAGVDPHEFQPSPADVQAVASADVVLISGKGLEGYLAKLEQSAGGAPAKYVDVGGALTASLHLQEAGRTVEDPHWWHSVANVRQAVDVIRDALSRADPADAGAFAAQAAAYQTRLARLESTVKLKVAELPRAQRKLVTSHDAFGYFARDYGFTVYPVEGVSTTDEPSSRQIAELVDAIRQQRVKAVFFESTQNPKVLDAITRETGAVVGGELYADGLGLPGTDAATYEGMMKHNVDTVVDALK